MAEWSGFFDAHKVGESWDRVYLAEDFAKFFSPLIGNGVFAGRSNELQVFQSVPAGMSVTVSSGQSWIDGYGYLNDSDLTVSVDPADGVLGRIDRIVNQWSAVDRQIRTVWKKGTPAVNPVAPPLRWDADYKELNLCTLNITAGLSAIMQDKIKDTRADSSVCGWVTGLIDQVDTSTLFAQWDAAYEKAFAETKGYLEDQKAAWEAFFQGLQEDTVFPIPSVAGIGKVPVVNPTGDGYVLKKDHSILSISLSAGAWLGDSAPYTQTIRVEGILETDTPHYGVAYSIDTTTALAQKEAFAMVDDLDTADGSVKFTCFEEKPEVDLTVQLEVNR